MITNPSARSPHTQTKKYGNSSPKSQEPLTPPGGIYTELVEVSPTFLREPQDKLSEQKHILYLIHEYGIGPRTLSRLTGVPYAIVQRATSKVNERQNNNVSMVCEDIAPYGIKSEEQCTEEVYLTYCDDEYFHQYPEY